MTRFSIRSLIVQLKKNQLLTIRLIILVISSASLISAFGLLLAYTPEVYIRGVPFSAVLKSLAFGGLLTVIERFLKIYEEITKGK